jgi:hypothetical protein
MKLAGTVQIYVVVPGAMEAATFITIEDMRNVSTVADADVIHMESITFVDAVDEDHAKVNCCPAVMYLRGKRGPDEGDSLMPYTESWARGAPI